MGTLKPSQLALTLTFIGLLLSGCGSGSDESGPSETSLNRSLAPKTITYHSENGTQRAVEQFYYTSGNTFQSTLFTDNGPDNLWNTEDDIATGHTLCRYEDQGFMAPMLQPLFLTGMSETETGKAILEDEGIDPQAPFLQRCPQRAINNLVEETRQCDTPECRELLGPVKSLHISYTQLAGRTLEVQLTSIPFSSNSNADYFAFTQTSQIHYNADGLPEQISESTTAPISPYGNEETNYLVQLAAENCPASPSADLDLTPTGVACRGLRRERGITLNDFQARITSQRYHGLYPDYAQQQHRYYDAVTERVYNLGEGEYPPTQEDNEVAVTDFSEAQVVRRYSLDKGADDVWFNEDDEEQESYHATTNSQGLPLAATLATGSYQFYYTDEARPLRIDYVENDKVRQQLRFSYPDHEGLILIEELRYSEQLEVLTLRTRTELGLQSSIHDFVGDFPALPKAHSIPDLRTALYGTLLEGSYPSLALLRSQSQGTGELLIPSLSLTGIQIVDFALNIGQVSGITLTGVNLGGGVPIVITGQ